MKKIYALVATVVIGSGAYAQDIVPVKPKTSVVHAGDKYAKIKMDARHTPSETTDRGTPYFYEDFEMGFAGNNTGSETSTGAWVNTIASGNVGFEITTVGHANDAGSTFTIPALMSTTGAGAAGQWVLLDSDSDGSGGVNEEVFLISPIMDFTAVTNNSLAVEFQQFFAEWTNPVDDSIWVEVSTDGSTWTQFTSLSDGVGRDNRPNPEVIRVNMTSANLAGEDTVQIRFHWKGQWNYGWQIDDVSVIDLPPHNLRLNYGLATHNAVNASGSVDKIAYTKIPENQVFDMELRGNITNLGANAQTNVMLNGSSGTFTGTSPAVPLNPNEDTTLIVSTLFNPTATVQSHDVVFTTTYANVAMEDDLSGLTDTFSFEITNNIYSRDRDDYNGTGLWNGDDGSGITNGFIMGNIYQIENATSLDVVKAVLTASTSVGALLYATVHQYDATNGEFVLIAQSDDYQVTAADIPTGNGPGAAEINVIMPSVALNAGESYLISIGHYGGPDAVVLANSTSATATALTTYLFDATDQTWYYLTSTPMIRAQFNVAGIENAQNRGISLMQNQPNPFNDHTVINYSLKNKGNVSLMITDITGKVITTYNEGVRTAGDYSIDITGSDLAAGIYNYTLKVDGNVLTKQMVVNK